MIPSSLILPAGVSAARALPPLWHSRQSIFRLFTAHSFIVQLETALGVLSKMLNSEQGSFFLTIGGVAGNCEKCGVYRFRG